MDSEMNVAETTKLLADRSPSLCPTITSVTTTDKTNRENTTTGGRKPVLSPPSSLTLDGFSEKAALDPSYSVHCWGASSPCSAEGQDRDPYRATRLKNAIYNGWFVESLSLTASLIALAAMIVLLKMSNDKEERKFPQHLTINSVLSWCSTVLKASLLLPVASCISQASWLHYNFSQHSMLDMVYFDMASRGPVGSLQLLLKFREKYFASIGAFITILALGIDPITQLALSIEPMFDKPNRPATVKRTHTSDLHNHVHVRWWWLSFPVTVLVLTVSFFGCTVWRTHAQRLKVWKSSPLPLLLNHVQEKDLVTNNNSVKEKITELENFADDVHVKLMDTELGLRLKAVPLNRTDSTPFVKQVWSAIRRVMGNGK